MLFSEGDFYMYQQSWQTCGLLFLDQIGIWNVGIFWGTKTGEPEEKNLSKEKNRQQTQPTCDAMSRNWTQATVVGGKCSHHCAIPASPWPEK